MLTNLNNQNKDNRKKKNPPPRPPPPDLSKIRKQPDNICLIEWSPPNSPRPTRSFGGSAFSSFSSSTSSLASSKKSFEFDQTSDPWTPKTNHVQNATFYINSTTAPANTHISMPTIIRAQPPKAKREREASPLCLMPSVPPPSPPKANADIVTPYGIALYDFPATQAGDLQLQANDVVILTRRVNGEWLHGMVEEREGIFPANFVDVRVPLPEDKMNAYVLYDFRAQMPGDLELKAGQLVKVIREVSGDWLYGECGHRKGQFPANYVDRIA